ncbi:Hypothetical predicted protein [Mytilus galloprovincialis]|uniref:Uncharacterized protein n=1 Tax=Mytilus galloprovincialis TaxID=29158 RepID=A0A8B6DQ02_MYTGA|nr:Hypothetical predicted protein [Mytilus galloprovincialis]
METCVDSQLDCHSIIHNDKIMFYTNRVGQRMGQLGSIPVMVGVELESVICIDKTRKTVIATLVECLKDIFRDFILWQAGRQGTFFCDEEVASLLCQFKPLLLKANIDVNAVEYGHDKFELLNDTLYTK